TGTSIPIDASGAFPIGSTCHLFAKISIVQGGGTSSGSFENLSACPKDALAAFCLVPCAAFRADHLEFLRWLLCGHAHHQRVWRRGLHKRAWNGSIYRDRSEPEQ